MYIAQLNIARMRFPLDSAEMAEFVAALGPINALADAAPGFLWRLQTEEGDATSIRPTADDRLIINLSVWATIDALKDFVYGGEHRAVMAGRRQWFERMVEAYLVLWWVPEDHRPDETEALERLDLLRRDGPTTQAFTIRRLFTEVPGDDGSPPATWEVRVGE